MKLKPKVKQKQIFLSHASKDKALADRLIQLLTVGCDVSQNDILYTSEPGMGIPSGYHSFIEYLQKQMQQPALVILLLSENYFASPFCLCELGATWGGNLPVFPLVVPPTDRAKLKATLLVTQAGYVNDEACLDELCARIKDDLGKSVALPLWGARRKAFLKEVEGIITALPVPSQVPLAKFQDAKQQYNEAAQIIEKQEEEARLLKAQIADLEAVRPEQKVKAIAQKYSTTDKEFRGLCSKAKDALNDLKQATCKALFYAQGNDRYIPDDWSDATAAKDVQEVDIVEGERVYVEARSEHLRVADAMTALWELGEFLRNDKNEKFLEGLEQQCRFPINLTNKDFWRKFLADV